LETITIKKTTNVYANVQKTSSEHAKKYIKLLRKKKTNEDLFKDAKIPDRLTTLLNFNDAKTLIDLGSESSAKFVLIYSFLMKAVK
jgi:hypothetical protein